MATRTTVTPLGCFGPEPDLAPPPTTATVLGAEGCALACAGLPYIFLLGAACPWLPRALLSHTMSCSIESLARVRVFLIKACVGYYTREVSPVPRTTPGAIYRPETRLPEQKLR